MSKNDMIDAIRKLNPTARTDFLTQFTLTELDDYLRKLQSVSGKRGGRKVESGSLVGSA